MTVLGTVVLFTAAWLAVGLGLFISSGSLRAMRPAHAAGPSARAGGGVMRALYVVPFVAGLALVAWGLVEFVRVVPW